MCIISQKKLAKSQVPSGRALRVMERVPLVLCKVLGHPHFESPVQSWFVRNVREESCPLLALSSCSSCLARRDHGPWGSPLGSEGYGSAAQGIVGDLSVELTLPMSCNTGGRGQLVEPADKGKQVGLFTCWMVDFCTLLS